MIPWISVSSSWVDAYYYDAGDLYIRFKDKQGKPTVTCHYANVPATMWADLLAAPSKGEYIHKSGLAKWPYTVI